MAALIVAGIVISMLGAVILALFVVGYLVSKMPQDDVCYSSKEKEDGTNVL